MHSPGQKITWLIFPFGSNLKTGINKLANNLKKGEELMPIQPSLAKFTDIQLKKCFWKGYKTEA